MKIMDTFTRVKEYRQIAFEIRGGVEMVAFDRPTKLRMNQRDGS
jgi:hypothetical protein